MRHLPLLLMLFTTPALATFEAHEWGTFTSLVGSNGISQNGMYHEDEQLPAFVHGFGVTQAQLPPPFVPRPPHRPCHNKGCFPDEFFEENVITQKMETPVIYFYSDQLRSVDVNVRFPEGVVTETFPAPVATSPSTGDIRDAANGNTTFHVDVLPTTSGALPYVDPQNIYSHARAVASNLVKINTEQEKFIFYRGIGRFQPRLGISSRGGALQLEPDNHPSAIYLVHVNEQGDGQLTQLRSFFGTVQVPAQRIARLQTHTVVPQDGIVRGSAMREALIGSLTSAGLRADEATAMINTWESGYLKVPGLRVLYILPREEVDQVLPLTITPSPEHLERVFVGRIEVLLDTEEQAILGRVLRERDSFQPASLGRFAEPMLRRALEVYQQGETGAGRVPDYAVLELLNRLIRSAAAQG